MEPDIKVGVFWFLFILGLISFGGLSVAVVTFLRAIPKAFNVLSIKVDSVHEIATDSKSSTTKIQKYLHDLKYQHDHPDQFLFGTEKTNGMLQEISNRLVNIEAGIEVLKQR